MHAQYLLLIFVGCAAGKLAYPVQYTTTAMCSLRLESTEF